MSAINKLLAREVIDYLPEPFFLVDNLGCIEYANEAFGAMLGYPTSELLTKHIVEYLHDASVFDSCMVELQTQDVVTGKEVTFIHQNSSSIMTINSVRLVTIDEEMKIFINVRDVSSIDKLNKQLNLTMSADKQRLQTLTTLINSKEEELSVAKIQIDEVLSSIDEIIWYIDDTTMQVQYVNSAVYDIFGVTKETFVSNATLWQNMILDDDKTVVKQFFMELESGKTQSIEFRILCENGCIKWLNNRITHHPHLNLFMGITFDVTEAKKNSDMVEYLAYHDILTKLPNRAYLKNEIEKELQKANTISSEMGVLFLDLDNFKYINDTMGHETGDEILIGVANRIQKISNGNSLCSRFGGDEFIILLPKIQDSDDIKGLSERLISSFEEPFIINEHEYFLSCSIGISCFPEDAQSSTGLIKCADTAMYEAKHRGKNQYSFYEKSFDDTVKEFVKIDGIIRESLKNDYFELMYQPLMDAKSQKLIGFEALLRLDHPKYGKIFPDQFIPVAESTGDILPLSRFVLESACEFLVTLKEYAPDVFVAINISAKQFKEKDFVQTVLTNLKHRSLSPKSLKIELTESVVMEDISIATHQLQELKNAGVKIALDDFGTGYSSFEYLAKLPIDTLKIDKSFILGMFDEGHNQDIIEAMTSLAHTMKMDVTAEGVETIKHVEYLNAHGIDILQGFYFDKAIPVTEVIEKFKVKKL